MRIANLPAMRWLRGARLTLPTLRSARQPMPERCRETFAEEVRQFADFIARAAKRRE